MRITEPTCTAAEASLLGVCLLAPNRASDLLEGVDRDCFADPDHETVYGAIDAVLRNGRPCDPVTVAEHMERNRLKPAGRSRLLVTDLLALAPVPWVADTHRDIVLEYARRRSIMREAKRLQQAAASAEADTLAAMVVEAAQRLAALSQPSDALEAKLRAIDGDSCSEPRNAA